VASLFVSLIAHPLVFLILKKLPDNPAREQMRTVAKDFYGTFILSAMLLFLPFWGLYVLNIVDPYLGTDAPTVFLVSITVTAVFNAWIAAAPLPTTPLHSIVTVVYIGLFLLMVIGLSFIPNHVMRKFKFGNLTNASLVLNEVGCAIAQHHGAKTIPFPDSKTNTTSNPKTCSLPSVTIHSRLGNMYYLEVSRMHFTMPGQNVLSWKVLTAGPPTSTQNPAPTH
jgi:hypothetical protein